MSKLKYLFFLFVTLKIGFGNTQTEFPFYEDYLKDSDFRGFIDKAKEFIANNPDAPEAPRLAYDLMMVGKAANNVNAVKHSTSLLLFKYTQSLPTLNFLSSFEKGSKRLVDLLIAKVDEGKLESKDFAVSFCRSFLLVARLQGPEILKDKSLRLRIHLLAGKAGIQEILSTTQNLLDDSVKEDSNYGKVVKILNSEKNNVEKIKELYSIRSQDAKFGIQFLLSQLNENESNSEAMIIFKINQVIFAKNPDPIKAIKLIDSLESKVKQKAEIQFLKSLALHFDGESEKAVEILNQIVSNKKTEKQWQRLANSFSDGLQFIENRKKVLTEQIGAAFEQFDKGTDCIFIKASLKQKDEQDYEFFLGLGKKDPLFEIQIHKEGEIQLAYRYETTSSLILPPDKKNIIYFKSSGVLPIPKFSITREIETGAFSYNFNLNFGSSFEEFIAEGSTMMDNAYLATPKGRDVLLSHILNKKAVWLGVPEKVDQGTSFPILSYSENNNEMKDSSLSFDLEGKLTGIKFGVFSVSKIMTGGSEVLDELPALPSLPKVTKEKFDFPLFMKILGDASKLVQK